MSVLCVIFMFLFLFGVHHMNTVFQPIPDRRLSLHSGPARRERPRALVIYVFSDTDPEYVHNLEYFLGNAIEEEHEYMIVLNLDGAPNKLEHVNDDPDFPSNVRLIVHENRCFDWGTYGWALKQRASAQRDPRYFVFVNSSVRGPFMPVYALGSSWVSALTSRLNDKLRVGVTPRPPERFR